MIRTVNSIWECCLCFQSQELSSDSAMDKMKKILSSPITRKKNVSSQPTTTTTSTMSPSSSSSLSPSKTGRYFGIPLEEILRREGTGVPHLVQRICYYIQHYGQSSILILSFSPQHTLLCLHTVKIISQNF